VDITKMIKILFCVTIIVCFVETSFSSVIDVKAKIISNSAHLSYSDYDIGDPLNCFDGDTATIMRSANVNPAFLQVTFDTAQCANLISVFVGQENFAGDVNEWWVETADNQNDLDNMSGSYKLTVPFRGNVMGTWDEYFLDISDSAIIWKFNFRRTVGEGFVHIHEIRLFCNELKFENLCSKIDINTLISQGLCNVNTSAFDIGNIYNCFDDDTATILRSAGINPCCVEVNFVNPREIIKAKVFLGQENYPLDINEWSIESADNYSDLENKTGSYRIAVANRTDVMGTWDESPFPESITSTIWRFNFHRTRGGDFVHIHEIQLIEKYNFDQLNIQPDSSIKVNETMSESLKAFGSNSLTGCTYNITGDVIWQSGNNKIITVGIKTGIALGISKGVTFITAQLGELIDTVWMEVLNLEPDLTVCYIKRLPEIPFIDYEPYSSAQEDGWPIPDQPVIWRAYIRNLSIIPEDSVHYAFYLDGEKVQSGILRIDSMELTYVDYCWNWKFKRHELTLKIDTGDAIKEFSEVNNELMVYTDALTVHFYVEHSVYEFFRCNQRKLCVGSTCWENWIQNLNLKRWNKMFADAIYPETPNGVIDRWRIDSIIIVPDGTLHDEKMPDFNNRTADIMYGYPANILKDPNAHINDKSTVTSATDDNWFFYESWKMHEMFHTYKHIIDNYGFNVASDGNSSIEIKEDGKEILGNPFLPECGPGLYYVCPHHGMMLGDDYTLIDRYAAAALNRQAGFRSRNNSQNKYSFYMQEQPLQNCLIIEDKNNNPIPFAIVSIYQGETNGLFYGKTWDSIPDLQLVSDSKGRVYLGHYPFQPKNTINGPTEGLILIKVKTTAATGYEFFEVSWCNMKYFCGDTAFAEYDVVFDHLVPLIDAIKSNPVINSWPSGTSTRFGESIESSSLMGGDADVPGYFVLISPDSIPNAGKGQAFPAIFIPVDIHKYNCVNGNITIDIEKVNPVIISWPEISPIIYGQLLSEAIITGGNTDVAGFFIFSDPDTMANAGSNQAFILAFEPVDTSNYYIITNIIEVEVNKRRLIIQAEDQIRLKGEENPAFLLTYSGFINMDTISCLDSLPTAFCNADITSDVGFYDIVVSGGIDNNYDYVYVNGVLTIASMSSFNERIKDRMQVFPDPYSGNWIIRVYSTNENEVTILFYDMTGRILEAIKSTKVNSEFELIWKPNDSFQDGVYLIRGIVGHAIFSQLIIIEKNP
jgi:hypothetical protein